MRPHRGERMFGDGSAAPGEPQHLKIRPVAALQEWLDFSPTVPETPKRPIALSG
jgi:hypothetical protein